MIKLVRHGAGFSHSEACQRDGHPDFVRNHLINAVQLEDVFTFGWTLKFQ